MKAVNLIPERQRPRGPTGTRSGSSYIFLGVLAVILIGALVYVLTLNSINSTKSQVASANQQAARDKALADQLGAYGDFDKIKTERVSAVKTLAEGRFDFERLMRELALLLPNGVWLTDANAGAAGLSSGSSPSGSPSSSSSTSANPALEIKGCAPSQAAVAVLLVRMHELDGATDATLAQSSRPSPGSGTSASSDSAGSSGGCGNEYAFTVDVSFAPISPAPAPPNLGGGS